MDQSLQKRGDAISEMMHIYTEKKGYSTDLDAEYKSGDGENWCRECRA